MKTIMINAPTSLINMPHTWSHDLTLEISELEKQGNPIGLIDNAYMRFDVEVLKDHLKRVEPEKVILFGGIVQYRFIKQYLNALKDVYKVFVRGFPPKIIDGLPVEEGATPPKNADELQTPNWGFLPLDNYFANSALPYNAETAVLTRRGVYKSRWGDVTQSPKKVAEHLRYLRIIYGFDFIEFDEDFSLDWKRSLAILDALEDFDLIGLFKWSCRANVEKVNRDYLNEVRRRGCTLIDYGEVDAIKTRDLKYMARMEVAIQTTKNAIITPLLTCTVGCPDTVKSDLVDMLKMMKSNEMETRPKLAEPYPNTSFYEEIKGKISDVEKHICEINESFVNYTRWSDEELLGICEMMAKADINRLEKIKN